MLVGCGMADHVGPVGVEHVAHPALIPHGADEGDQVKAGIAALQLHLDIVGVVLIDIKNYQTAGREGRHLAAELAAYGAAAAGDQDGLALDLVPYGSVVRMYLSPAQQVLYAHVFNLGEGELPAYQLVQGRQGLQLGPCAAANLKYLVSEPVRGRGYTEDYILYVIAPGGFDYLVPAANDFDASDPGASFSRVVVDKAHDPVLGMGVVLQVPDDQDRPVAGAD